MPGEAEMPVSANQGSRLFAFSAGLCNMAGWECTDAADSLMSDSCILAHRRVACAAKPPGLDNGSAHVDAIDEMDEDREEREDTSEIIDSGDDSDELDLAREDLRADVGYVWGTTERQDGFGVSKVIRAALAFRACSMAMLIEDRRGPRPSAPTAGVLKVGVKLLG